MKHCSFVSEFINDRVAYERIFNVMHRQCLTVKRVWTGTGGIVFGVFVDDTKSPSDTFGQYVMPEVARVTATPVRFSFMEENGEACVFEVSRSNNGRLNAKTKKSFWQRLTELFR